MSRRGTSWWRETYRRFFDVTLAFLRGQGVLSWASPIASPGTIPGRATMAGRYARCPTVTACNPSSPGGRSPRRSSPMTRTASIRQGRPLPCGRNAPRQVGAGSLRPGLRRATRPPAAPLWGGHAAIPALAGGSSDGGADAGSRRWSWSRRLMFGTDLAEVLLRPDGRPSASNSGCCTFWSMRCLACCLSPPRMPFGPWSRRHPCWSWCWRSRGLDPVVGSIPGRPSSAASRCSAPRCSARIWAGAITLGRIIFLLATAMSIAVCLSMALVVLVPSIGVEGGGQVGRRWMGASLHKNALGATAGLACLG